MEKQSLAENSRRKSCRSINLELFPRLGSREQRQVSIGESSDDDRLDGLGGSITRNVRNAGEGADFNVEEIAKTCYHGTSSLGFR